MYIYNIRNNKLFAQAVQASQALLRRIRIYYLSFRGSVGVPDRNAESFPQSLCIMSAVQNSQVRLFLARRRLLPDLLLLGGPAPGDSARQVGASAFDSAFPFSRDLSQRPPSRGALSPPDGHRPSRSRATRKVRFVRPRSSRSRVMLAADLAWCNQMAPSGFLLRIAACQTSAQRSARPCRSSS